MGFVTGNRAFAHRQVHQCGKNTQGNGQIPDDVLTAGLVIQVAAKPDAHEGADLVAEKDETAQH